MSKVFISYSHKDSRWKDLLVEQLKVLESESLFEVWHDRTIPAGADWQSQIESALDAADIAIMLISASFLTSEFILKSEVPNILKRRELQNLPLYPIIVRPCPWQEVAWLQGIQVRPTDGKPLAKLRSTAQREEALAALAKEILQVVRIDGGLEQQRQLAAAHFSSQRSGHGFRSVGQRPYEVTALFKDRELQRGTIRRFLEGDRARMVGIIGRGGMGKTALACKVLQELEAEPWLDPSRNTPVNGIVYLSTRTSGITLERLFLNVSGLLSRERQERLQRLWQNPDFSVEEKIQRFLTTIDEGLYIVLLDDMQDLLDSDGSPTDPALDVFLRLAMRIPHRARYLITSRESIKVASTPPFQYREVPLAEGLPLFDGVKLLREFDEDEGGALGLGQRSDEQLRKVVEFTHGVPRALEIIASILHDNPLTNIDEITKDFYKRGEVVQRLVEENYRRLNRDSRYVLEALAVFGCPVPVVAVDYLLQPFAPGLPVPDIVDRLVRAHTINGDRYTKLVTLHPIDQEYAYSQLPSQGPYTAQTLHRRASEYYLTQRLSKNTDWENLEEIDPQLRAFDQLVRANDYDQAASVLREVAIAMSWRGFSLRSQAMLEQLQGRLTDSTALMNYYLCACANSTVLGPLRKALDFGKEALQRAVQTNEQNAQAQANRRIGLVYRYLGKARQSLHYFRRALEMNWELGIREFDAALLFELSIAYCYCHDAKEALKLGYDLLATVGSEGSPELKTLTSDALCVSYYVQGDLNKCLEQGRVLLSYNKEPYGQVVGYGLMIMGLAFRSLNQVTDAFDHIQKARQVAIEQEHPRLEGLCSHNLAVFHYLDGDFDSAREWAETAVTLLWRLNISRASQFLVDAIRARKRTDRKTEAKILLRCAMVSRRTTDHYGEKRLAAIAGQIAEQEQMTNLTSRAQTLIKAWSIS